MSKIKRTVSMVLAVLLAVSASLVFTGCGPDDEIDTSGKYLVIYDGQGGFLGNKATTVRKLFCEPGGVSLIPNYPTDYADVEGYTVPSLGLAQREGYSLLGWYTTADYEESENGTYIRLDGENGVFENAADGTYVRKYVADENGSVIYLALEEAGDEGAEEPVEHSYLLILPTVNEETGEKTEAVEPGFYLCDDEAMIGEISDDATREAYKAAFDAGLIFTEAEAAGNSGWKNLSELSEKFVTLTAALDRYVYTFAPATADDSALDHYALVPGYASIDDLFTPDENGAFIQDGGDYVAYVPTEPEEGVEIVESPRCSVDDRYVFKQNTTVGMKRYAATMKYWNFAKDHVKEEDCEWDGEKFVLTLHAHWVKMNSVCYHYMNKDNYTVEIKRKLVPGKTDEYVSLSAGETIGKMETIPTISGKTFVGWSKNPDTYDPWDFNNDVFPDGTDVLDLYAYYVDGEYTRIISAKGLGKIGEDPAGKYLIVNDIDLGGASMKSSPLGLKDSQVFTGEIYSFGATISGFTYEISPNVAMATDTSIKAGASLIPVACNAKIEGLNVSFDASFKGLKSIGGVPEKKAPVNFYAALIGTVLESSGDVSGKTAVKDCNVSLTAASASKKALESDHYLYSLTVGSTCAYGKTVEENVTATIVTDDFVGSVEIIPNGID